MVLSISRCGESTVLAQMSLTTWFSSHFTSHVISFHHLLILSHRIIILPIHGRTIFLPKSLRGKPKTLSLSIQNKCGKLTMTLVLPKGMPSQLLPSTLLNFPFINSPWKVWHFSPKKSLRVCQIGKVLLLCNDVKTVKTPFPEVAFH